MQRRYLLAVSVNREKTFPLDRPTHQREHAMPQTYHLRIDSCHRCGGGFARECVEAWQERNQQLSETQTLQGMQGVPD